MRSPTADAVPAWRALLPHLVLDRAAPHAPPSERTLPDHTAALEEADVGTFIERARATSRPLTIVVNDDHRFTDTRAFLDVVFRRFDARLPALRLLVAAGSHRAGPDERAAHERRVLGPWARRFEEVCWHDASDPSMHARVGRYTLHRWMAEGGAYLGCGSMEPHYFAGVTGVHKTLTVGVMSLASLTANHAGALSADAGPLRLDGNPVHVSIGEVLAALEHSGASLFGLNQILIEGTVRGCTAGRPLEALTRALDVVRMCCTHPVPAPLDLVVACVAPPLDRDLYQADKGIKNTEAAVRDGGLLLLEAACPHGVGLDHFVELLRTAPTLDAARRIVRTRGYRLGDHKAVRLRALTDTRRIAVGLVSDGIDPALADVLGMRVFADRKSAAGWAAPRLAHGSRGLVVEDAGNLALTTEAFAPPSALA